MLDGGDMMGEFFFLSVMDGLLGCDGREEVESVMICNISCSFRQWTDFVALCPTGPDTLRHLVIFE